MDSINRMINRIIIGIILSLATGCSNPKYPDPIAVSKPTVYNVEQLDRYLIQEYGSKSIEHFVIVLVRNNTISDIKLLGIGNDQEVTVTFQKILQGCIEYICDGLIIVHNHPNRFYASPSAIDIKTAKKLEKELSIFGINLIDSVVITDKDTYWIRQEYEKN